MGAGVNEEKYQFCIALLPDKEPVRLDVTFPISLIFAGKFMRPIFRGSDPLSDNSLSAVFNLPISKPLLIHFLRDFSNLLVVMILYIDSETFEHVVNVVVAVYPSGFNIIEGFVQPAFLFL